MYPRILFVLRDGTAPSNDYRATVTSGVATSTRMIVEGLVVSGYDAKVVGVSTESEIAHVVGRHQPTHVIVETLWVNPTYFDPLMEQFPDVHWIVREHSESCFRVLEPYAFEWIIEYLQRGIEVMSNSMRSAMDVVTLAEASQSDSSLATWGPNIYPIPDDTRMECRRHDDGTVHIGCFGAVRLMKNHITQAVAAIAFADKVGCSLRFHINGYDIPGYIDPILNNLRLMFKKLPNHELVEHGWMTHDDFLVLLRSMDIVSQVSFTETFNIVAADAMYEGVPLVTSKEVSWLGSYAHRDANSSDDIAIGYTRIWEESESHANSRLHRQRRDMERYTAEALTEWIRRFA